MASFTPALALAEAQPAARDNSGMRSTAVVKARVARAVSVGHSRVPSTSSFVYIQSRWVDHREEEPGSSSSAWLPRMPEPALPPSLGTRQQPPVKAPLAPPPRVRVAPALGNDILVKPPLAKPSP